MSDEGTKLSAAEAAKKAEEAIRNAEMLEKIARDAANAAAQAREEAEQAKGLAKEASKKTKATKAAESVKKAASLAQKDQSVDRKFVLDYLQKKAWDLHKQLDNIHDIRFEDDPPRVVMVVVPGPEGVEALSAPKLVHNGVEIPVELEVKKPASVMVGENVMDDAQNAIITEDEKPASEDDEVFHRSITGQAAKTLGVKEALGPHSMDQAAKQREAYAAWLKRHPGVKVHKGSGND